MMETKNKKSTAKKKETKPAEKAKKISKTGLAMRALAGTGKILDMRAVLK